MLQIILLVIVSAIIGFFSYRGGVWLWINLSDQFETDKKKIAFGASALLFVCGGATLLLGQYLFHNIDVTENRGISSAIRHFTFLLAISLAYNLGYLFSILPARKKAKVFSDIVRVELFLLPLACLLCVASVWVYAELSVLLIAAVGSMLFFIIGFTVWEKLRQSEFFLDESFTNTLWKLSVGFDLICIVIVLLGVVSQYFPHLLMLTGVSILLVFISLSTYCLGLIATVLSGS